MEKTRAALEKARRDRELLLGSQAAPALRSQQAGTAPDTDGGRRTPVVEVSQRHLRAHRIMDPFGDPRHTAPYKMLRTQLLKRLTGRGVTTLGICSARYAEGKTTTAINLALSLSFDVNHTVLLVDLDLRKPSICSTLGISVEFGLDDYFAGRCELADCLVSPGFERLVLLPTREPVPRSSDTLLSPKMRALAHELRGRYPNRLVLYDLPPVLASDDCIAFIHEIDACLFVVREGWTSELELERAKMLVGDEYIIGSVLNRAPSVRAAGGGYY